jgi:hypothetical protein
MRGSSFKSNGLLPSGVYFVVKLDGLGRHVNTIKKVIVKCSGSQFSLLIG